MDRALTFLAVLGLFCLTATAAVTDTFTWAGASNTGPYTLAAGVSSVNVSVPTGAAITENDMTTHQYQHHTRIGWQGGVTFLAFSSAGTNESDTGMQVGLCFSYNKGATWSAITQVVPSQSAWVASYGTFTVNGRACTPRNFQSYGGVTYLISCSDHYTDTGGHPSGDALIGCAVYTNGTIGSLFLITTNTYSVVDGKSVPSYDGTLGPALLPYSRIYGTWGGGTGDSLTAKWSSWFWDGVRTFTEMNTFPADDTGTNLFRFWRNVGDAASLTNVWQCYSTNSGANWSAITASTIPNAPSETVGLRLSDGRFAIIGNPHDYTPPSDATTRDPLFLAVTDVNSTTVTNVSAIRQGLTNVGSFHGWGKAGGASYVSAIQVSNYLYVGYSIYKESIAFSRVPIPGLPDNNNDPQQSDYFAAINAVNLNVGNMRSYP